MKVILEENSHQKVRRLAESSFQYHFPICFGRLCVRDFIAYNSSELPKRTFLPCLCYSCYCFGVVFILPLLAHLFLLKITMITRSSKLYLSSKTYKKLTYSLLCITHILLSRTSLIPAVCMTRATPEHSKYKSLRNSLVRVHGFQSKLVTSSSILFFCRRGLCSFSLGLHFWARADMDEWFCTEQASRCVGGGGERGRGCAPFFKFFFRCCWC